MMDKKPAEQNKMCRTCRFFHPKRSGRAGYCIYYMPDSKRYVYGESYCNFYQAKEV